MTDDEEKFIETLMRQIEQESQNKRDILNDKLMKLDERLLQEDRHISELIEKIIFRTQKREENTIEQLEELRSLVSHRDRVTPPPLPHMDTDTEGFARRFAPVQSESIRDVVEDSMRWAN